MAEAKTLDLNVAAKSDVGLKRKENQDRMTQFYSPFGEVFLVSDGMGGHRGGALAASLVREGMTQHLRALPPETPIEDAIRIASEKTNEEVLREGRNGGEQNAGMGATLVLVVVQGNDAVIAHIGDSRAYLFREGHLRRLTRDHTRGQQKVDAGLFSEEESWDHPDSSVLTCAFGHTDPLLIDISAPIPLQEQDILLICSDGLCGYVRDSAIAELLASRLSAKDTVDRLVALAHEAGGHDNVTVQVIQVGVDEPRPMPVNNHAVQVTPRETVVLEETPLKQRSKFFWIALLVVVVGAIAGAIGAWRSSRAKRMHAPVVSSAPVGIHTPAATETKAAVETTKPPPPKAAKPSTGPAKTPSVSPPKQTQPSSAAPNPVKPPVPQSGPKDGNGELMVQSSQAPAQTAPVRPSTAATASNERVVMLVGTDDRVEQMVLSSGPVQVNKSGSFTSSEGDPAAVILFSDDAQTRSLAQTIHRKLQENFGSTVIYLRKASAQERRSVPGKTDIVVFVKQSADNNF